MYETENNHIVMLKRIKNQEEIRRGNSMKLGMPTLIELNTLEDNAKLCKELGLDFIEINMNLPQFQAFYIVCRTLK